MAKDWQWYIDVLKSTECQCGRSKRFGHALCRACYGSLPRELKRALYQRIGNGFEENYEAAVSYLKDVQDEAGTRRKAR